jgi:hypothetical protein
LATPRTIPFLPVNKPIDPILPVPFAGSIRRV